MSTVLVTGGSGFIGSHCILQLLAAGHSVRTTVRNLAREADVRALLKAGGAEPGDRLKFFAADLEKDAGWPASGRRLRIRAARRVAVSADRPQGRKRADRPRPRRDAARAAGARDAGVKRVVLTSSFAAIGYGHEPQNAAIQRDQLDQSRRRRRASLREIEDSGRAGRVGLHRPRRGRPRALGRQPGRRVGPGAGGRLLDVDPARAAAARRRHARLSEALFRRGRRPRRGRPAPPVHDKPGGQGQNASSPWRAISSRSSTSPRS